MAPSRGGTGAGARSEAGKEVAGGYDGGGEQHSLSDRQQLVGGRHAGADAHHEKDRVQVGRAETQGARSHAQHTQASAGDCLIDPAAGTAGRRAAKAGVSRAPQLDTKSDESGEPSIGGSEAGAAGSSHSPGRSDAILGDYGGAGWASGETNGDTDFRRRPEVAGKPRECVRAAPGNYSQTETQQPQHSLQPRQNPSTGKPK